MTNLTDRREEVISSSPAPRESRRGSVALAALAIVQNAAVSEKPVRFPSARGRG